MGELKRIDPISAGKVVGLIYLVMGFVLGTFVTLGFVVGAPMQNAIFGKAAVLELPIVYGIVGFLLGSIGATLYNLVSKYIGGVKIDISKR